MRGELGIDSAKHVYTFIHKSIFLLFCKIDEFKGRTNQFWHFLSFKAKHILHTMVWNLGSSAKFKGQLIIMKLCNAWGEMTEVWWWIRHVTCSFWNCTFLDSSDFLLLCFCCLLFLFFVTTSLLLQNYDTLEIFSSLLASGVKEFYNILQPITL